MLSSFDLTNTPSSPPRMRWTNSPSFALKITLGSHGQKCKKKIKKITSIVYTDMFCKHSMVGNTHLDWVSPDLTRSLRMWKRLLPHQSDQLMMASFSQPTFTISRSPISSSVVMRKVRVLLVSRVGLQKTRCRFLSHHFWSFVDFILFFRFLFICMLTVTVAVYLTYTYRTKGMFSFSPWLPYREIFMGCSVKVCLVLLKRCILTW